MKLSALIRKEFHRFFHDPRLIVTILLPGVIIFALYTVFGSMLNGEAEAVDYKLYASGGEEIVAVLQSAVEESGSTLEVLPVTDAEEAREAIRRGDAHALVLFSEDFGQEGSGVEIWYDLVGEDSRNLYQLLSSVLQAVGMRFSVNAYSLSGAEEAGHSILAETLPFLVMSLVFSACMSVTLESVAGEKERGTLATILATSVPRHEIALGKVVPLSCIAAIGAASGFLGVIFSMPKLMGISVEAFFSGFGAWSYFALLLAIMSFVPLIVSAIAVISAYSKSVKEASAYTGVVMIVVMVLSLASAFVTPGDWALAVPVLNAVVVMGKILTGAAAVWQTFVCVGANLLYTVLLVFLIAKMFSSERIMFGK